MNETLFRLMKAFYVENEDYAGYMEEIVALMQSYGLNEVPEYKPLVAALAASIPPIKKPNS